MNKELLKKISLDLGLKTHSTPYKWMRGIYPVPASAGKQLEALTGIDRRKFCWPNEFGSPWPDVEMIYQAKLYPLP